MARNLEVYPKVVLDAAGWLVVVKVIDHDLSLHSRFVETFPAAVSILGQVGLLKVVLNVTVGDGVTDRDIADALLVDDIKPGGQTATVWDNWRDRAESVIDGLPDGFTVDEFVAVWSKQDTAKTRTDARRALVTQRGWAITGVHQHEGDGTSTDE